MTTDDGATRTDEYTVKGEELVAKFKELLHEGNVRRIIVSGDDGRTLVEIPLTIGVVGALLAPALAVAGAVAAFVTESTVTVVRQEEAE